MSLLPGPQLRLAPRAVWRRELRELSTLLISAGDRVEPDTILAEGLQPVPAVLIHLGKAELTVPAGSRVRAGEPIGRRRRLLGRGENVLAPVAGVILQQSGEDVLLQPPPRTDQLRAQLPGTVAAIQPDAGVDVEGPFGLLAGCPGSGVEVHGRLGEDIAVVPEPLTPERLHALAGQGIRAVIAASWASGSAIPDPTPLSYLLTEPRAGQSMAKPIADALQRRLGAPAAIQFGARPWLAFGLDGEEPSAPELGPGCWLRLPSGAAGQLVSLGSEPRFFPSGLRALPADIDLGDRTETFPLDSLEWIA